MTRWDLNAVVLCHCQRYFAAVTAAIQGWQDPGDQELGQLASLLGNVLWARSAYVGLDRAREQALSVGGAVVGTIGGRLGELSDDPRAQALALVAAEERLVLEQHDELLAGLAAELVGQSMTPGEFNRWVWERLFPQYPYSLGTSELQAAVRERLGAALGRARG
jgi:hypothetical protein